MVRKSKGFRSKTRSLLRKKPREAGKIGLSRLLHSYRPEEKVVIKIDPAVHKGMPHRRYHGMMGTIIGQRGRGYIVKITAKDREKKLIIRPEHLQPSR